MYNQNYSQQTQKCKPIYILYSFQLIGQYCQILHLFFFLRNRICKAIINVAIWLAMSNEGSCSSSKPSIEKKEEKSLLQRQENHTVNMMFLLRNIKFLKLPQVYLPILITELLYTYQYIKEYYGAISNNKMDLHGLIFQQGQRAKDIGQWYRTSLIHTQP